MKTNKNSPTNPSSIKTRLALRFLRAMKKLNKNTPPSPSVANKYKRYQAIRAAAYASMASAVGPQKAWSRAILRKIRNRKLHRTLLMKERKTHHHARKGVIVRGNPRNDLGFGQENDLRELVPGGKALDFGRLLNETGHYIKCLRAQVEFMRKILGN
ncbi:hypothetical protein Pfo_018469 [Paulownia fortunei]|nr:hypothetical protein Pfo_018469 [Paulownia fortunei]